MKKSITRIRSTGLTKVNQLARAARYLDKLKPAFAEWQAGEIYVCKKTNTYRYRFGRNSKAVTRWDAIAREVFTSPAAFAFAAMVFTDNEPITKEPESLPVDRANVIALANAA
jgi:hypothetical protein